MEFFNSFLKVFNYFVFIPFIIAIIRTMILVLSVSPKTVNTINVRARNIWISFWIQFIILVALSYSLDFIFDKIVRKEIVKIINSEDLIIKINDKVITYEEKNRIAEGLKNFKVTPPQHSGPTGKTYKIELITKKENRTLYLKQNDIDSTIFHVWDNTYETEIGNVKIESLK